MKIVEVISAKEWFNPDTGATASIYGAVPYHSEKCNWIIREIGFTFLNDNGTVGNGRKPFKSRELAEKYMELFNAYKWDEIRKLELTN